MKKILIGLALGIVLAVPASVFADRSLYPVANDIYETNCGWSGSVDTDTCRTGISVFDDANNKCYVAYDREGGYSSISCIKGRQ